MTRIPPPTKKTKKRPKDRRELACVTRPHMRTWPLAYLVDRRRCERRTQTYIRTHTDASATYAGHPFLLLLFLLVCVCVCYGVCASRA